MMSTDSPARRKLLDAILPHVAFDGWSQTAFDAALADAEMTRDEARTHCPKGAVDLAIEFHKVGDQQMVAQIEAADLEGMRFRDKVAFAIRARIKAAADDKEAVRRGSTLFALPMHAADGAKLIWGTADLIWDTLGDTSEDVNWYTKRATLSGVYTACILYWLGDDSVDMQATDAFIDRRIDDVMQIEKVKAQVNNSALLRPVTAPLNQMMSWIKRPNRTPNGDLPGVWAPRD